MKPILDATLAWYDIDTEVIEILKISKYDMP